MSIPISNIIVCKANALESVLAFYYARKKKGERIMQNQESKDKIPAVIKKIGEMTYKVRVYFNEDSKENLQEKMERIIREEVKNPSKQGE